MAPGSARWVCRQAVSDVEVEGLKARLNAEVTTMDNLNTILIALQKQERAVKAIKGSYNLFLTALTGGGPEQLQVEFWAAENWVKRNHQNHPAAPIPMIGV
ncbi:hypothetical protein F5146DRAFT_1132454 [Armillaria mellea]|nr:hypothetical protein F5146DRAFT_1132454 [Armillaria mellea]